MQQVWWLLSRSSGVVAAVLITASLLWGLSFTARSNTRWRSGRWWLDLHKYLGGLALAFTGIHLVAVFVESENGIGIVETLIPLTAPGWAWGIGWGVLAAYLIALVVLTSWPTRRLSRRTWRSVHSLSLPAAAMVGVHAVMVGSSRGAPWFTALLAACGGLVAYPAALRLLSRRRATRTPSVSPSFPAGAHPSRSAHQHAA